MRSMIITSAILGALMLPHAAAAQPLISLNVTGNCPGSMKVCINGANTGDVCGIVRSFTLGTFNVPSCGPIGGLNSPVVVATGTADSFGMFCVGGNVPPFACGFLFVQGVDQTQCLVTAVVLI